VSARWFYTAGADVRVIQKAPQVRQDLRGFFFGALIKPLLGAGI